MSECIHNIFMKFKVGITSCVNYANVWIFGYYKYFGDVPVHSSVSLFC